MGGWCRSSCVGASHPLRAGAAALGGRVVPLFADGSRRCLRTEADRAPRRGGGRCAQCAPKSGLPEVRSVPKPALPPNLCCPRICAAREPVLTVDTADRRLLRRTTADLGPCPNLVSVPSATIETQQHTDHHHRPGVHPDTPSHPQPQPRFPFRTTRFPCTALPRQRRQRQVTHHARHHR